MIFDELDAGVHSHDPARCVIKTSNKNVFCSVFSSSTFSPIT